MQTCQECLHSVGFHAVDMLVTTIGPKRETCRAHRTPVNHDDVVDIERCPCDLLQNEVNAQGATIVPPHLAVSTVKPTSDEGICAGAPFGDAVSIFDAQTHDDVVP